MQCHYEVLSVPRDADEKTIKKAHRKLAIQYHPDKTGNNVEAAEKFRLIQEAYECLSDATERRWYDDHREALLKGWSPNAGGAEEMDMVIDLIPFMRPGCYNGYDDLDENGFYSVYTKAFSSVAKEEADAVADSDDPSTDSGSALPFDFGDSTTDMQHVVQFYHAWESFTSRLSFSWADHYDAMDADNRRVRRAMEDENKKMRRAARKARNEDVLALVHHVKRRDPRIKVWREKMEREKAQREKQLEQERKQKKEEKKEAREQWKQQAHEAMLQAEEEDRLAGRVRLADLEDDYDYGGGKKKGRKNKNKSKKRNNQMDGEGEDQQQQEQQSSEAEAEPTEAVSDGNKEEKDDTASPDVDNNDYTDAYPANKESPDALNPSVEDPLLDGDGLGEDVSSDEEESSEEEEPDVWRCECCRKDFKSEGQMENHMKSKKHKEAYKKHLKRLEREMMA